MTDYSHFTEENIEAQGGKEDQGHMTGRTWTLGPGPLNSSIGPIPLVCVA